MPVLNSVAFCGCNYNGQLSLVSWMGRIEKCLDQ